MWVRDGNVRFSKSKASWAVMLAPMGMAAIVFQTLIDRWGMDDASDAVAGGSVQTVGMASCSNGP